VGGGIGKWGAVKSLATEAVEPEEKVRHYPNAEKTPLHCAIPGGFAAKWR